MAEVEVEEMVVAVVVVAEQEAKGEVGVVVKEVVIREEVRQRIIEVVVPAIQVDKGVQTWQAAQNRWSEVLKGQTQAHSATPSHVGTATQPKLETSSPGKNAKSTTGLVWKEAAQFAMNAALHAKPWWR